MSRFLYADHAATTALSPRALEAMMPYFRDTYGNPSSLYAFGQQAKSDLDAARAEVARCLNAKPEEIFFTSGGTESDNWALKAVAELRGGKGRHIITSAIEHHAILHTLEHLEKAQGFSVTYLPVDSLGRVDPQAVKAAIRPDTILITVMAANNEIGTIEPIAEIAAIAREAGVLFHTDAVQAVGHIPVDVSAWNCDMLSLSGHKFHGPRGVGALYVRRGLRLPPLIHGGGQEKGRRSGTENVAGAVGLAAALREAVDGLEARYGDTEIDTLVRGGVTPVEQAAGVVSVVRGVTTRTKTGEAADATWRELTTIRIVDDVIPTVRDALRARFRRAKNTEQSRGAIRSQVVLELENKLAREIITGYGEVSVEADADNPTVCLVDFSFTVAHGLNQIWLSAHITV